MTNNEKFGIYHPEMAIMAESIVAVGLGRPNDPEPDGQKVIWLDLDQIVHIEPLPSSARRVARDRVALWGRLNGHWPVRRPR
jgi:hypothetical protein